MKRITSSLIFVLVAVCAYSKKDVTQFLGIPIDDSKSAMMQKLKAKGFRATPYNNNVLEGQFNGMEVELHVVTNNDKVCRIMLCDANPVDERSIQIRFNKLCYQFEKNPKYMSLGNELIPDDEDISYEMAVHNKRYEAIFYQLPEGDALESLQSSILQNIQEKYSQEQLDNASDELKSQIFAECASELLKAVQNKPVWFMIAEHYGKYYITMFYDNELNRAQGQDL